MRKRFYFVSILMISTLMLSAQHGDHVYSFLRLPTSAHANALGGHTVSIIESDPSLVFHNPALLGAEMDGMINLNFMKYVGDIYAGSAVFAKAFRTRSSWGLGASFVHYGKMKAVSVDQQQLGYFSAQDICMNGFYSYELSEKWRGGVSLKMLYSTLAEYHSLGVAVDAGLSYYDQERAVSYGIVLKNIGAQLKAYDRERATLPWDFQLGVSKRLSHAPIRFSLTAMDLTRWQLLPVDQTQDGEEQRRVPFFRSLWHHLVMGVDLIPSDQFWAGVGYNPKRAEEMKMKGGGNLFGGFSAGAGIRLSRFEVSVSAARYHPSALSMMVSLSVALSDAPL